MASNFVLKPPYDIGSVACQEFGLTVSEKKTEPMHLWSHPHTASDALRIEAAGQRYKQTTEFVHLGDAIRRERGP